MENLQQITTPNPASVLVPNKFPVLQHQVGYRIAIIGEAPGADEVLQGEPFVGMSGRWLNYLLNRVGIMRAACYLGNVTQHRPPNNRIATFDWNGKEIQDGLTQLTTDMLEFQPHLCLLLGSTALRAAKGHPKSITNWRGSLFSGAPNTPFAGLKCLASFHPASTLRTYEETPLLLFDLKRARHEAETPDLVLPQRTIRVAKTVEDVELYLNSLEGRDVLIGTDIEGYVSNLTCISFAADPLDGFVVPFSGPGGNYWSVEDELKVWLLVKRLLENTRIKKVLQNGLYDRFVLAYTYGILIRGATDDTLVKHWELYCELEKKLSVQVSIYTKEPYYKDERGSEGFDEFWRYNGKDSCVTLECSKVQDSLLVGPAREHYHFNMAMQNVILYMEMRGLRYDSEASKQTANEIRQQVYGLQHTLNKLAGQALSVQTKEEALRLCIQRFALKRSAGFIMNFGMLPMESKKAFRDDNTVYDASILCENATYPLSDSANGHLSMLLDSALNVASSDQMQQFLYTILGMPTQYVVKYVNGQRVKKPSCNALSLLKLYKWAETKQPQNVPIIRLILTITRLRTQLETLEIKCDPDGRIRCSYNIVGTETGRLSCKQSPTRSGYNLQTVTKKQRKLFLADEGHYFFQCDLSGADGWTVAAHCARLGDTTMLEDYRAGLKPALIIALMSLGENVSSMSRDEIRIRCNSLKKLFSAEPIKEGWRYMGCKRVQHGSNYEMKPNTMSDQVLQDSWKYGESVIYIPPSTCGEWQSLYFQRYYGVPRWQEWVKEQVKNNRKLTSANGHTRRFFGRPNDHDTYKAALSDEPQNNTTFATNTAVLNLWNDLENRLPSGGLIIESLHQIHDAYAGQFPIDKVDWAKEKINQYNSNKMVIAGQPITIPAEGAYGSNWYDLDNPI